MCRFVCYKGAPVLLKDLIFNTSHSLIDQSKYAKKRNEPVNGDGFGIGWYPDFQGEFYDPEPGVFKSIEPAWNNRNLLNIASKIRSRMFFAHIRDASADLPVSQPNCHPFQYGKYLWMHNGWLCEFEQMRRITLKHLSDKAFSGIQGNTDSEHAFALFLDEIKFDQEADDQTILDALFKVIDKIHYFRIKKNIMSNAEMNFAVTNGESMFITRFSTIIKCQPASLFYAQGVLEKDEHEMTEIVSNSTSSEKVVVVASEPLSHCEANWQKVERNFCLHIDKNGEVKSIKMPSVVG
ncbi:MAG: class II glutamine amidotransferase [Gammaproteobacteria bacterium]|nr:class II glutamine amidotransferase [Gammaproteobacteria bacterium]